MAKDNKDAVKKTAVPVKKPDVNTSIFGRIKQWLRDLKAELKKVVWPTRSQIINNTLVSLAVMAFFAIILWGFDSLAQAGVRTLIELVG